jgi:hypothetical protein
MCHAFDLLAAPGRIALNVLLLSLVAATSGGCIATEAIKDYCRYNDNSNDFVMGWRNSVWAREAWHSQKSKYAGHPQFHAFGEGFRDGYIAVASGGNGCPPPVPPRKYWNWRYQTPEGQAQVAAWWEGYPYGAKAADEDGAGLYQQIQVSHPIQVQYSPEFLNPANTTPAPAGGNPLPGPAPNRGPVLEQVFPIPQGGLEGLPELAPPAADGGASSHPPSDMGLPQMRPAATSSRSPGGIGTANGSAPPSGAPLGYGRSTTGTHWPLNPGPVSIVGSAFAPIARQNCKPAC